MSNENESQAAEVQASQEVAAKKPFDLKDLEAKLKARGLPHVEGLAKAAVDSVFEWVEESVQATDSKVDDFALAILPPLKSLIHSKIDGIAD